MSIKPGNNVTRQIQTVFVISILLLLISSAASFYSNRQLIDATRMVNHTNDVLISSYRLMATVRNAESDQRGFLITGNPFFTNRYSGAQHQATDQLAELKSLTSDNAAQQQNLTRLKVLIDQRFLQLQRVLSKIDGISESDRAAFFVKNSADFAPGIRTMQEVQTMIDAVQGEETRLMKIRTGKLDIFMTYTPVLLVAAALLSILISVLAFFRIKADIDARTRKAEEDKIAIEETSRRINAMEGITTRIADGDFSARSDDDAQDELGRISAALNKMGGALGKNFKSLEDRRGSRKALPRWPMPCVPSGRCARCRQKS